MGVSPLDETGQGHRGRAAIERFWDNNIAPNSFVFNIQHSYEPEGGFEVCNVGQIVTRVPSIKATTVTNGVFVYRGQRSRAHSVSARILSILGHGSINDPIPQVVAKDNSFFRFLNSHVVLPTPRFGLTSKPHIAQPNPLPKHLLLCALCARYALPRILAPAQENLEHHQSREKNKN